MSKFDKLPVNSILCGDCLHLLPLFPKESVDLVYLDPPFFSGKDQDIVWDNDAELTAYTDSKMYWREEEVDEEALKAEVNRLAEAGVLRSDKDQTEIMKMIAAKRRIQRGDISGYIDFMSKRLREIHRVLKPTGSMYLHCDWHASHYLKLLCDEIFGYKNFLNEIVWWYRDPAGTTTKRFKKKHDILLFYAKTYGKQYFDADAVRTPYSEGTLRQGELGTISFGRKTQTHPLGKIREDVWEVPIINSMAKERLGYPTQKPEALLEIIVKASSKKGSVVLDPFAGGGTTLIVANRLGRKWIGVDVSPTACTMIVQNFARYGVKIDPAQHYEFNYNKETAIIKQLGELKKLDPLTFQKRIAGYLGFVFDKRCISIGIDGRDSTGRFLEVKSFGKVGQGHIDRFGGKMVREGCRDGIFVAYSFTAGAHKTVAKWAKKSVNIRLLTVHTMLKKQKIYPIKTKPW